MLLRTEQVTAPTWPRMLAGERSAVLGGCSRSLLTTVELADTRRQEAPGSLRV
ncbi:hypothetical protein ACIBAI_22730 [Streptomyces sp. NPDC051041]|uniref:hypothetical protein n=1 Tax=Streptomyces sp. NPDC051041 TaxID=3365640 RepID=UPI00379481E8